VYDNRQWQENAQKNLLRGYVVVGDVM